MKTRKTDTNLDDPAWHGTNIGTSVTSDLSLISDPPNRDPLEGAQQHLGDGAGQAGLACARRTHKAQDGSTRISASQPPHSQVLHDAVLHLQNAALADAVSPYIS